MIDNFDVKQAQENFKKIGLDGWLEDWDVKHIYDEVKKMPDKGAYLEIGVAFGKSMSVATLAAHQGNKDIFGIDVLNWGNRETNIDKFTDFYDVKNPYRFFIEGDSQSLAKKWKRPINVLYIDGDHTSWGVIKDIASWIPHVVSGGVIMFDDYGGPGGVQTVVDLILKDHSSFTDFEIDGQLFKCRKL